MFHDKNEPSPLDLAKSLTPWGMKWINEFNGLEIHPCQVIGSLNGEQIARPCAPEQASFWTVYGHYKPDSLSSGIEALEDCPTESAAQKACDGFLKCYPHLSSDRPSLRQAVQDKLTP
ncbi:MAG: hypothetical protein P4M13_02590 [Alphaproteobacteria bacterium]|nr:hypothetical protein [Alphaproteobacteria bacterium]